MIESIQDWNRKMRIQPLRFFFWSLINLIQLFIAFTQILKWFNEIGFLESLKSILVFKIRVTVRTKISVCCWSVFKDAPAPNVQFSTLILNGLYWMIALPHSVCYWCQMLLKEDVSKKDRLYKIFNWPLCKIKIYNIINPSLSYFWNYQITSD